MIEETLINETPVLSKAQQLRKEKRAARRKRRRRYIRKGCCSQCGQPKHYICLEHNQHRHFGESFFKRLFRKRRYYARKLLFTLAEKL